MRHHAQLVFIFLVETEFELLGQAALELPTSGDPPASASQNAGITGVSHHARPDFLTSEGHGSQIGVALESPGGLVQTQIPPLPLVFLPQWVYSGT